jgi:hypothetical protein
MRDFRDSKSMARALRSALEAHDLKITHSESLELMARIFGYDNWNILAAKIEASRPRPADGWGRGGAPLTCSFCSKPQQDVALLIAGPNVAVCNECVRLCDGLVEDQELLRAVQDETAGADGLGAWTTDDLRRQLERIREALSKQRELVRTIDERPGELEAYFRSLPPAELRRRRAHLAKQVAQRTRSVEVIEVVLRARE